MKLLQRANSNNGYIGNSILIFLVRVFPSLANLLVVIFFSRMLDKTEYGIYQNFWVNVFLLSTLASLGVQSFVVTYAAPKVASLLKSLRAKSYFLITIWIVGLGLLFGYLQKDSVGLDIVTASLFLIIYSLGIILEALLTVFKRFKLLLWVSFLHTALFVVFHYMYLYGSFDIKMLFVWLLLIGAIKLIPFVASCLKDVKAHQDNEDHDVKEVRSLWLHVGFFEVSQRMLVWVDKFILGLFLSNELFAVYFNGTIQIPFLPLLLGAVGSALLMQMAEQREQGDDRLIYLVNHSGRVLSAVVFPLFFFFLLYRYELFHVVFTNKYESAIPIFFVTIMVLPLRAYNFTTILQNKHKGATINIGVLIDLISILMLMYPLYRWLGLPGVALSFVLGSYVQGAYYLYMTGKVTNKPFYKLVPLVDWFKKLIILAVLGIGIHYLLCQLFTEQIVLILGILVTIIFVVIALYPEIKSSKRIYGEPVSQEEA